jgi:hypothetical protein
MMIENINLSIYIYVIHENTSYHCILFEDKELNMILPYENREIDEIMRRI